MKIHLGDRIRTDDGSFVMIEFALGGRAGISADTTAVVATERDVNIEGNQLLIKNSAFWASIDDREQQLQIQTAGGTIGIHDDIPVGHPDWTPTVNRRSGLGR